MTNMEISRVQGIVNWLIGPARQNATPDTIVTGIAERLVALGVPLRRVRIGQSVANPLTSAWGIIWTREGGAEHYTVPRGMLATDSYYGSPIEHVITTRTSFRRSLERLVAGQDHPVLFEVAAAGSTDYLALPLQYGDNSVQVGAFTTDRPGGFTPEEVRLIESLAPAIAAALEPAAMRHSTSSLLEVYLGNEPAARVANGAFHRGDIVEMDAAVLITDLRDFTGLSERLAPDALLERLDGYFELVVEAVRAEGGDVLKFIGDGVLSVFSAEDGREGACRQAMRSIGRAFGRADLSRTPFVAALHVGPVVYGNVGSLDRLDFTVVGPTVNYVSRLETMAKALGQRAVCSAEVAAALPAQTVSDLGTHGLKGIAEPQPVFGLALET
jgi:adenylate cyclase